MAMKRILEPEIMNDLKSAEAYSNADFEAPHNSYVKKFSELFPNFKGKMALDLGCGPADVTVRFAKRYPELSLRGIDASYPMIRLGRERLKKEGLSKRVVLLVAYINKFDINEKYDLIISSSLLHHLPNPNVLWEVIKKYSKKGTIVYVADLMRPETKERAGEFVNKYSGKEPEILKEDFYNSLLASFSIQEIRTQLKKSELSSKLKVESISDRHLVIYGII